MRYQRVKNVAWRRIGAETVVVNLGRRRMMALNEAGGAVWEALSGGGSVAAEASPFLADLEAEGVVERLAEGDGGAAVAVAGTPAVLWREELHRFGTDCAFMPTQSEICNQGPQSS